MPPRAGLPPPAGWPAPAATPSPASPPPRVPRPPRAGHARRGRRRRGLAVEVLRLHEADLVEAAGPAGVHDQHHAPDLELAVALDLDGVLVADRLLGLVEVGLQGVEVLLLLV